MDTPPQDSEKERPAVSGVVVVIGFALMVEGILASIASIPLILFGGIGLLGAAGGAGLVWAGWLLAGLSEGNARLASLITLIAGGAVTFVGVLLIAMATCASFMNCGPAQSYGAFLPPMALGAFNLSCAMLLWRRG